MSSKVSRDGIPNPPWLAQTYAMTFIRAWRKHRNVTQAQLGEAIGRAEATISRIESGEIDYNRETLEGIAAFLRVTPGDLLDRDPADEAVQIFDTIRDLDSDDREWLRQSLDLLKGRQRTA